MRRRQSQGGLHRHDAGVQLRSGDTDRSPRLETALLLWDPVHSIPPLPIDRSDIDVHGILQGYEVCVLYEYAEYAEYV